MSKLHVEALTIARGRIKTRKEHFICSALSHAPGNMREAVSEVRMQILQDLDYLFDLGEWLECNHHVVTPTDDALRTTRLAWIDAMIEYWRDRP